jgi:putative protease
MIGDVMEEIGVITHYYGGLGVAAIKMSKTLNVGDKIKIKGATTEFEQTINSMQVDHKEVKSAKKGDEIGIKVKDRVRKNDKVFKV